MKFKNLLLGGLVLGMSALLLTGCGSKDKSASSDSGDKNVTIRFSWWGDENRNKATKAAIKAFEKKNPNIKVKAEIYPISSMDQKIGTQMSGGTEPDVMQGLYAWLPQYSKNGNGYYDLEKLKGTFDLSQYSKTTLDQGRSANGVLNGIAHGKNVMEIALNWSAFERLGIKEVPKTWDDYVEAAKKFPKGSHPIVNPSPMFMVITYLQQLTGKAPYTDSNKLNYSKADLKKALAWYKDMVDKNVFVSRQEYLDAVGSQSLPVASTSKWINGEWAGDYEWSGGLLSNEEALKAKNQKVIIAPIPEIEGAKSTGAVSKPTFLFYVSKHTKNPKAAAKLLQFLFNDPEGIKLMGTSRGVPESKIAAKTLKDEGTVKGIVKDAYDYGQKVKTIPEVPNMENSDLVNVWQQQLESYELGKSDLNATADALYTQIKSTLANLK